MANRRQYLGSSDAAALLGIDPWRTEESVFRRIVLGEYPEHDEKTLSMFRLGKMMEAGILAEFTHRTGLRTYEMGTVFHPDHAFIGTTPDAAVGADEVVEAKTVLPFAGSLKKWVDGPPEPYRVQCQHHLMVTGRKRCHLPALFGTHRFEVHVIERDEEFIRDLLAVEVAFWKTRVEPALKERAA